MFSIDSVMNLLLVKELSVLTTNVITLNIVNKISTNTFNNINGEIKIYRGVCLICFVGLSEIGSCKYQDADQTNKNNQSKSKTSISSQRSRIR